MNAATRLETLTGADATELAALMAAFVPAVVPFQTTITQSITDAARRGDRVGIRIGRDRSAAWLAQVARIRGITSKRHLDATARAELLAELRSAADMLRRWNP